MDFLFSIIFESKSWIFAVKSIIFLFLSAISSSIFLISFWVFSISESRILIVFFNVIFFLDIFFFFSFIWFLLSSSLFIICFNESTLESESNNEDSSFEEIGLFSKSKTCCLALKLSKICAVFDFCIHKKFVWANTFEFVSKNNIKDRQMLNILFFIYIYFIIFISFKIVSYILFKIKIICWQKQNLMIKIRLLKKRVLLDNFY
ncbi:MAG: hypothetical protein ACD_4C00085G0001 [uncultured bacterium (gcode 4)]|uniref:Transmembrane protein n=1 Tax=uncultured bacterium (gcode 4) TaxID=1234023 RepID=K2F798_9BACT|nr:MAG: hypothetical protein ACD_4C00085G0001 [uncultured bacterium (gcode 4)]